MGYFSNKNIAKESRVPAIISLSGIPNFVEFAKVEDGKDVHTNIELEVLTTEGHYKEYNPGDKDFPDYETDTEFSVEEIYNQGEVYSFVGTNNPKMVNDKTFLLDKDPTVVAENIRGCLLRNPFFRNRFDITIPFVEDKDGLANGKTLYLQSLGVGQLYHFKINKINTVFLSLIGSPQTGRSSDCIDRGLGNVDIELDVYSDTGLFLGADDKPTTSKALGKHMVTMCKSYFGQPIWFDINSLMGTNKVYSDKFLRPDDNTDNPQVKPWTDAGTVTDFRLIGKKFDGTRREVFYYSNLLYAITGYARTLDKVDLSAYVYDDVMDTSTFRLLTNQPTLPHIKGQKQYFNFILKDPKRGKAQDGLDYQLGVYYDLCTQSGKSLAKKQSLMKW